jgi:phosphohistidine phosphatase SixA
MVGGPPAPSDVWPSVVLCSSSLRTRETLAAILPALGDVLEIRIGRQRGGRRAAFADLTTRKAGSLT